MRVASRSSLSVKADGLVQERERADDRLVHGDRHAEDRVGPDVEPGADGRVVRRVVGGVHHPDDLPGPGHVSDDALPRLRLQGHQGFGFLVPDALEVQRALLLPRIGEEDGRRGRPDRGRHAGEDDVHQVALLLGRGDRLLGLEEEVQVVERVRQVGLGLAQRLVLGAELLVEQDVVQHRRDLRRHRLHQRQVLGGEDVGLAVQHLHHAEDAAAHVLQRHGDHRLGDEAAHPVDVGVEVRVGVGVPEKEALPGGHHVAGDACPERQPDLVQPAAPEDPAPQLLLLGVEHEERRGLGLEQRAQPVHHRPEQGVHVADGGQQGRDLQHRAEALRLAQHGRLELLQLVRQAAEQSGRADGLRGLESIRHQFVRV